MEKVMFSIVTPTYNCAEYLEQCIISVMNQRECNFEHIIVDGGSTDGTLDIIKKYDGTYNMRWVSEKDNGMYDAINKGFAMAQGKIFSWINADDIYLPWTLEEIKIVFEKYCIHWCTGREGFIDEKSRFFYHSQTIGPRAVNQKWIKKGYMDNRVLGFIMQESTFWTRELWEKAGGIEAGVRYAGDYLLWKKFAQYEPLYLVNSLLACFRRREGQLSGDMEKYYSEIPSMNLKHKFLAKTKLLFLYNVLFKPNNKKFLIQIEKDLLGT